MDSKQQLCSKGKNVGKKMSSITSDSEDEVLVNENHLDETVRIDDARKSVSKCHVNRVMLPCKIAYLSLFTSLGAFEPFINVFLRSVGFSPAKVGLITGIRQLAQILGNPLWGILGDKTRKHKVLIVFLASAAVCFNFPLPWIAKKGKIIKEDQTLWNGTMSDEKNSTKNSLKSHSQFLCIVSITFSAGFVESSFENYVDGRTMKMIDHYKDGSTFGQQRFFGDIGYAFSSLMTAILTETINADETLSIYAPLFFVYLIGMLSFILNSFFLFRQKLEVAKDSKIKIWRPLFSTIKKPYVIFFYATVLMNGTALGVIQGFFFLHLEDLGTPKIFMGISVLLQSSLGAIFFPFSARVIKFVGGPNMAEAISLLSFVPACIMISYIEHGWILFLSSLFHVLLFPLFWAAAIEETYNFSPEQISTTMLGLLNVINVPCGNLIANMTGGLIYDKYGGPWLFRGTALLCLFWGSLVLFTALAGRRWGKSTSNNTDQDCLHENLDNL